MFYTSLFEYILSILISSGIEIMETKLAKQTEIIGTTEKVEKTEVG